MPQQAGSMTPTTHYPALGVGARAIIVNDQGGVLLVKRPPDVSFCPGAWELPGGKMDARERLVDALAREVREETGLTVRADEALPVHVSHFVKEPFWVTTVTFICPGFQGEVQLSPEHVEHAWVAPQELAGRDYAASIEEQLAAYVRRL